MILDTLVVIELIKQLCTFYGTRKFVIVLTKAHTDKFSRAGKSRLRFTSNTACPTHYRPRHFFNNSNTIEDIATKFEQEYVHCVRNEKECVCSVCL